MPQTLVLHEINASYKPTTDSRDKQAQVYEGESKLQPPTFGPTIQTTRLYSCRASDLLLWLEDKTKVGTIAYIDCRLQAADIDQMMLPGGKTQFRNAYHIPMSTADNAALKLSDWKTAHGGDFKNLLKAKYVVVHCAWGIDRSPAMTRAYVSAWMGAPIKDRNMEQKICLLNRGYTGGWLMENGWPETMKSNCATRKTACVVNFQL